MRHRRAGILALTIGRDPLRGRVVVGTHYPSDVLAGAALGTLAALFFWWPPVRQALADLADWASRLYERLAARILPAPSGL